MLLNGKLRVEVIMVIVLDDITMPLEQAIIIKLDEAHIFHYGHYARLQTS